VTIIRKPPVGSGSRYSLACKHLSAPFKECDADPSAETYSRRAIRTLLRCVSERVPQSAVNNTAASEDGFSVAVGELSTAESISSGADTVITLMPPAEEGRLHDPRVESCEIGRIVGGSVLGVFSPCSRLVAAARAAEIFFEVRLWS
jgi:hypothetical protein